ncbi:MAG TPA: type 4a pilus biogenesis protein PilO [Polyangiaceae bacterium]|nr:type 4a pilus biogenesis protein PilO [Polyangiaceae bacterium]
MAESVLAKMPMPARIGIGLGLLILGGLAYYVVFYTEISGQIERTLAERGTLESSLKAAHVAEKAYQKDLEELARRRERERELNKVLPQTTEYPAFLSSVQSVANISGVELTAWTPQPEIKEEYYARVPMKVNLTGRFHQIAKFFYGIGQNDRIMNMENISLTDPHLLDRDVYVQVEGLATAFRALTSEEAEPAPTKGRRR